MDADADGIEVSDLSQTTQLNVATSAPSAPSAANAVLRMQQLQQQMLAQQHAAMQPAAGQVAGQHEPVDTGLFLTGCRRLKPAMVGELFACDGDLVTQNEAGEEVTLPSVSTRPLVDFYSDDTVVCSFESAEDAALGLQRIEALRTTPIADIKARGHGPGVYRAAHGSVSVRYQTTGDMPVPGYKHKSRAGKSVAKFREQRYQQADPNLKSNLALKAENEQGVRMRQQRAIINALGSGIELTPAEQRARHLRDLRFRQEVDSFREQMGAAENDALGMANEDVDEEEDRRKRARV